MYNYDVNNPTPFGSIQEAIDFALFVYKDTFEKNTGGEFIIDYNTVEGQFVYGFAAVMGQYIYIMQDLLINKLLPQLFPLTANEDYLQYIWGQIFNLHIITQTPAIGNIIIQGVETATVPQGTEYYIGNKNYTTQEAVLINSVTLPYISIVEFQDKIRVKLSQDYLLADNMVIKSIDGGYIGENIIIKAISTDEIEFDKIEGISITAQTGNINIIMASVKVQSIKGGVEYNIKNGETLSILNPVSNIGEFAYVNYDGIIGGQDNESLENYRQRILFAFSNIPQGWNETMIQTLIRRYNDNFYFNSKIFVPRAENTLGQSKAAYTSIYMLKEDLSKLSLTEVNNLKEFLDYIYPIKDPANTFNFVDIEYQPVNIKIQITNNQKTIDMVQAIKDDFMNNYQYDDEHCFFRKTLYINDLRARLRNVFDINGTNLGDNFNLIEPLNDVMVGYNHFPILNIEVI